MAQRPATILNLCSSAIWIEDGVSIARGKTETVAKQYETFMAQGGVHAAPAPGV